MAFVPSVELLAKLRASPFADRVPVFVRTAVGDAAVYIGGTICAWWFLTSDGRVLEYPDEDSGAIVREKRGQDATLILALCARRGMVELLDLLPAAPAASTTCSVCNGSRYLPFGDDNALACFSCHGLGWRVP